MSLTRRQALFAGAAALTGGLTSRAIADAQTQAQTTPAAGAGTRIVTKGRLKQSVSRWCYQRIPMPDFCKAVADIGLRRRSAPAERGERLKPHGLICSMAYAGGSIPRGLNNKAKPRRHRAGI
jgi:hydroxypyruvate isomerase